MAEKQKILVVDDEPEIREVLQMMLSSEGYEKPVMRRKQ